MSYRQGDPANLQPRPGAWTDGAVARDLDSDRSRRILAELQQKLESLPLIEQAKGILMARFALDADRAFDLLVRWSQVSNVKLRTICDSLVGAADDPAALDGALEALQQRVPQIAAPVEPGSQSRTSSRSPGLS